MNPAYLFGAAVALAVLCTVALRIARSRRVQELQRAAAQAGLSFEETAQPFTEDEMTHILRFTRRRGRSCRNVARGVFAGLEAVFFEHHSRGGSLESVAGFRVTAPAFELVPLRHAVNPAVMTPVFQRLGFVVMTFDDDPAFCRHYLLLGRDEEALKRLFTPALRSLLCRDDALAHWAAESGGGWLLVYLSGRLARPAELPHFLEDAAAVAALVRGQSASAAAG